MDNIELAETLIFLVCACVISLVWGIDYQLRQNKRNK